MARIAFCGLGMMGRPMAERLLAAGHELTVWNRTPERAAPLAERGARAAATPIEAAEGAEAVVTMLATPDALEAVVLGEHGLAPALGHGTALIEMSTVGPYAVRDLAARLPAGVEVLDAPVLGSIPQATDGTLEIFVGGTPEAFARWEPVLRAMGTPARLGPLGAGAAMKLVVNSALLALMATFAEAMRLSDALELDPAATLDVLAGSAIGVTVRRKRDHVERGEFPPNFRLALAAKDAGLVDEAAGRLGLGLPVAAGAREWMEAAVAAGLGDLDYSAVVAHARGTRAALPGGGA